MKIAFIGLGNMGGGMAANLVKAGHEVRAFDLSEPALAAARAAGCETFATAKEACKGAEAVVSMLPNGAIVKQVYWDDVIGHAPEGAILLDCSTIDVATAREVISVTQAHGYQMVDAPVSGGIAAAAGGTLTFMVGGSDAAFAKARPILEKMGKNIVHTGAPGSGQAAKIVNNMILGITMIGVAEGFLMGKRLGLDMQKLFDIVSTSSGSCWAVNSYLPVPGPVPASPANRDFAPGFTADNMLKDLRLAQQASQSTGASTPMGAEAAQLFTLFVNAGNGGKDFSGIIRMLDGK